MAAAANPGCLWAVFPWLTAGRLFGSYRPRTVYWGIPGGQGLDNLPPGVPVLQHWLGRAVGYRGILSLGLFFMAYQLVTDGVGGLINAIVSVAAATVVVGTPGVLIFLVVALWRAGDNRPTAWRESRRLVRITALTSALILFALGDILPFVPDQYSFNGLWNYVNTGDPAGDPTGQSLADASSRETVLMFALWPVAWYLIFFLASSAYLVHNNSFGVAEGSVFEPYISAILAWSVAISFPILSTIGDDFIGVTASGLLVLGASIVTALAAYQLRTTGASLQTGPWASADGGGPERRPSVALNGIGLVIHLGFAAVFLFGLAVMLLFLFVNVLIRLPDLL